MIDSHIIFLALSLLHDSHIPF